jgi:hypothetical protein
MNIIAHTLSDKGSVISNELEFAYSNLPWLNKNRDNIRFIKATDDNKILIEDIAKGWTRVVKQNCGHRSFIDPKYLLF